MSGDRPIGVLVTRPAPGLAALAAALEKLGYRPVAAPMLRYRRLARVGPADLQGVGAVALTSAEAARAWAEDRPAGAPYPAYAVGGATAAAARAAGFDPVISADGAAADLVARLAAAPPPGTLLVLRARETAADLTRLLAEAAPNLPTRERITYAAETTPRLSPAAAAAYAAGAVDVALLLSARTARSLRVALLRSGAPKSRLATVSALAISRQAAEPLRNLAFRRLDWVETPTLDALLTRLRATYPAAKRVC